MLQLNFGVWRLMASHADLCAEVSVLDLRCILSLPAPADRSSDTSINNNEIGHECLGDSGGAL